jgi:hypothetical protein
VLDADTCAWWDVATRAVRCAECGGNRPQPEERIDTGTAGRSARAEHERRHQRWEAGVRERHPHIGGLLVAVSDEPQSASAWAKGAVGEEGVGAFLDRLSTIGCVVLHDRRIPGSRANIDHIVIAPSGVWVVDAKHYSGRVESRRLGASGRGETCLFVGGHDRTKLVEAMHRQSSVVARSRSDPSVPVRAALCFVGTDWPPFSDPFTVDGVLVTWRRAFVKTVGRARRSTIDVPVVAAQLSTALPHC